MGNKMEENSGRQKLPQKALMPLLLVLALAAVLTYALSGVSVSKGAVIRWSGGGAGTDTTEGGNITLINVSSTSLTDKWAAYYGNITGSLSLTNGTYNVYVWSWSISTGGKVCIGENSTLPTSLTNTNATAVNTAFSLGSAADNATNTFTAANCTMAFSEGTVTNTAYAKHQSLSTFFTCPVYDNSGQTGKTSFMFCTNISNGTSFHNQSVNYEIMVPTTPGTGTETYYFYAEFN